MIHDGAVFDELLRMQLPELHAHLLANHIPTLLYITPCTMRQMLFVVSFSIFGLLAYALGFMTMFTNISAPWVRTKRRKQQQQQQS
jgi:hypothetical protein